VGAAVGFEGEESEDHGHGKDFNTHEWFTFEFSAIVNQPKIQWKAGLTGSSAVTTTYIGHEE